MEINDLALNSSVQKAEPQPQAASESQALIFKFNPIPLLIFIYKKWRIILAVFFIACIFFGSIMYISAKNSKVAWSASAKVFHQTRSDKIPTFYKPMETAAIAQLLGASDVFKRVNTQLTSLGLPYDQSMLSNVEITLGKSRESMITITASAGNPKTAAAIASAVAEEGVKEYVRRQNDSIITLIDDRKRQRKAVQEEISHIVDERKKLTAEKSGLPPDLELAKVRDEISTIESKKSDLQMRLTEIGIRTTELNKILAETPKEIPYETTIDTKSDTSIDGKKAELERLRKRYTEVNPKIIILIEEIQELEEKAKIKNEQTPSKIAYRRNLVYMEIESQLISLGVDQKSSNELLKKFDEELVRLRIDLADLLEQNYKYANLVRRENGLHEKSSKIDANINDLDFIVNTSVPDVSVFELARVPTTSNIGKLKVKVIAISIFTTIFATCILLLVRIAKLRMLSSKEYKIALGVEDLGDIPSLSDYGKEVTDSAIQKVYSNLISGLDGKKKLLYLKYVTKNDFEEESSEFVHLTSIQGLNVFRLYCMPVSKETYQEKGSPDPDDLVSNTLISVQKFYDKGYFFYQNDYSLDVTELDLLKFDINLLSTNYDMIVLEVCDDEKNEQAIAQISTLADYVMIMSSFDTTSKIQLSKTIKQIKETSALNIGGALADIPKPYYIK